MEICIKAAKKIKKDIKVETINAPYRAGEQGQRECFDCKKAREVLGYNPKVNPRKAIRLTGEWIYREFFRGE